MVFAHCKVGPLTKAGHAAVWLAAAARAMSGPGSGGAGRDITWLKTIGIHLVVFHNLSRTIGIHMVLIYSRKTIGILLFLT